MRSWLAGGRPGGVRQTVPAVAVLAVVAALLGWWLSRPATPANAATGPGDYVLGQHNFYFTPSHMTWHVGEHVTLTIVNDTNSVTGAAHEFMMGHGPRRSSTMLGTRQEDGFVNDFFTGMTVWFGDAKGVDVLMPGKARVTGSEASKLFMRMPMSSMSDGSGSMGAVPSASPSMSMGSGDSTSSMSSMSATPSASPSPSMSMGSESTSSGSGSMIMKGNGLMIDLVPGGTATVKFTVPDRPGTWTYGCFDQSGQHFLNGMRGTVTIVR